MKTVIKMLMIKIRWVSVKVNLLIQSPPLKLASWNTPVVISNFLQFCAIFIQLVQIVFYVVLDVKVFTL